MTQRIRYEVRDRIGLLSMDDGKANAMGSGWLAEFDAALARCREDATTALVITGRPGVFSAGLDLEELPALSAERLRPVTDAFMAAMRDVFLFPKPVVAASAGHAIAGGMMLYLAADLRVAADETTGRYGLNEATTGIPLLGGTLGICQYGIPPQHHTELILHGRMLDAPTTHALGLSHALVEADGLVEAALARAAALADVDPTAYAINKRLMREPAYEAAVEGAARLSAGLPQMRLFKHFA